MPIKILGLSASLRSARRGAGNQSLIAELQALSSKEALVAYLKQQAASHLQQFLEAGRSQNLPFDLVSENLSALVGDRGLSNSEIALSAALWGAQSLGCVIQHLNLSEFFTADDSGIDLARLKSAVLDCDGLLLATPVIFGDHSSLAHRFVQLIRNDLEWRDQLRGKVYGGIAVGARRSGGQETALVYQMLDMAACGWLGVGNDSETGAHYGGTGWAGDIGTMANDHNGLDTAIGAGRRVGRIAAMLGIAEGWRLVDRPRIAFWILQDKQDQAARLVRRLIQTAAIPFEAHVLPIAGARVDRCLACDVCPTHLDVDDSYRCLIKTPGDWFTQWHEQLLRADAIVPVVYSPHDRAGLVSRYQEFIERTCYLRRGDFVFSDLLCAPLVLEDLGASENMATRMMTAMLRQHTIVFKPLTVYLHQGVVVNEDQAAADMADLVRQVERATVGRLITHSSRMEHLKYSPVCYILNSLENVENENLKSRHNMMEDRVSRTQKAAQVRLRRIEPKVRKQSA